MHLVCRRPTRDEALNWPASQDVVIACVVTTVAVAVNLVFQSHPRIPTHNTPIARITSTIFQNALLLCPTPPLRTSELRLGAIRFLRPNVWRWRRRRPTTAAAAERTQRLGPLPLQLPALLLRELPLSRHPRYVNATSSPCSHPVLPTI